MTGNRILLFTTIIAISLNYHLNGFLVLSLILSILEAKARHILKLGRDYEQGSYAHKEVIAYSKGVLKCK